ncbi:hypothetical protein KCO_18562 [Pectobacterium brasiliense ICMP 19477]|nr:hypothetical protein KCO_18562 [Pectobacterium brasiliense ICMP 19477]
MVVGVTERSPGSGAPGPLTGCISVILTAVMIEMNHSNLP